MTRSSQPVCAHIFEFDDGFERTLRRTRNQQEAQPPNFEPELEKDKVEGEEEPTAEEVEQAEVMAAANRTIKELSASGLDNAAPLCIQCPVAVQNKTDEFELKSSLLHHIPKYHGLSMDDPNKHLKEFEVVCFSMTPVNVDASMTPVNVDASILYELAPGTVTSWESMKKAFLEKFFPTSRVILLKKRISGIQQGQRESFLAYYECFKGLVASGPQYQMKEELHLQYFYDGLLSIERQMLDASVGGALVDKTPVAAKTLIANRALHAQQYEGIRPREPPRQQHQVNGVSAISELQSQMANLTTMLSQFVEGPKMLANPICGMCSIQGHSFEKCPQLIQNGGWESTNAIGFQGQNQPRNDPYSNTYNPSWRDHPNFKWREPQQPRHQGGFQQQPPGFFPKPYAPTQSQQQSGQSSSGILMNDDSTFKLLTTLTQEFWNQAMKVRDLKKQFGQMVEFMGQFREQGKFPSSTIANPNGGIKSAKAITLRSGKQVGTNL